ncbi:MAG: TetR/AcrR family transcriptional regulator [Anaerolineae bacterium]|nr:TetR/AcrR family transcriptional regulator [Anaerolineae bacterium]
MISNPKLFDEEDNALSPANSTRNRILDAALNAFSHKGYHDTRLDEIVSEAATSKGSIYLYFPNKERLFLALVDQFANVLERRVTEAIAKEPKGIAGVRAAVVAVIETFGKYRRPAKILLIQAVGLGTVFEKKRREVTDRFAELIRERLDEAVALGDIAPTDTVVVSHAWMGAIYNLMIQWVYTGEPTSERILNTLVPLLLNSVGHSDKPLSAHP